MNDNKSLSTIVNEALEVEQMLMTSGGEMTPEIESALALKELNLPAKVDRYSIVMDRMDMTESYLKSRAKEFSDAAAQVKKAQSWLKDKLKFEMSRMQISELEGNDVRFVLTESSGSLVITSEDEIPLKFKSEETKTVIDTKALKLEIAAGAQVPGATIEPGFTLKKYINKGKK